MYTGASFSAEFTEKASNKMRSIVSRQKKRFTYGNYDLDLSCILPREWVGQHREGLGRALVGGAGYCGELCHLVHLSGSGDALTVQTSLTTL